jgi:hypothetical protein
MSSPNIGGIFPIGVNDYVDLQIYDRSDAQIAATMRAAAQYYLPGWDPNEGSPEMVLMEMFALAQAEQIMAINRVPGAVTETLLRLAGLDRDYGAAPTATVSITFADALGHTVPGGTRLYLRTDEGEIVTFLTDALGAEALRGATTCTTAVIGDTFTAAANGTEAGTSLVTADPLPFVDAVRLITDVVDGRDPENGREFLDRGVARLARLSDTLVVPRQFAAAAEERAEVERAVAVDNFDPGAGPYVTRTNLIPDPSYETGASRLKVSATRSGVVCTDPAISSSGTAADGKSFAFVNITGASGGGTATIDVTLRHDPVAVTPGVDYRFEYSALSPGTAYYCRAGVEWLDASGTVLPDEGALHGVLQPVTINGYRVFGFTARAPLAARQARLLMGIGNATSGSSTPLRIDKSLVETASTYSLQNAWTAGTTSAPGPNTQDDPGHLTVAVLGDGPARLSAQAKAAIAADLSARAVANLTVHVVDVDMRAVPVRTRIAVLPGYVFAGVAEAVQTAIRTYLNPLTWTYGPVIRHNEMVSLIDQVEGVDYVDEVWMQDGETDAASATYTTGNLTLAGLTALPVWSQQVAATPTLGRGIVVEQAT